MNRSLPRAFTLIELLVVLGVTSIIVAMLMPSLRRSRELARMVVCASNERQIGITTWQYCLENPGGTVDSAGNRVRDSSYPAGSFPDFLYDWVPGQSQSGVILLHFQPKWAVTSGWSNYDPKIMVCPSDPAPEMATFLDETGQSVSKPCSYDVNVDFLIRNHSIDQIKRPSQLAWLWDGDAGNPAKQGSYRGTQDLLQTCIVARHMRPDYLMASVPSTLPMAMINPFAQRSFAAGGNGNGGGGGSNGNGNQVTTSLGGVANILWVDGHVTNERSLSPNDIVMSGDSPIGGPGNSGAP